MTRPGHRSGERHPKVTVPDATVELIRQDREERDMTYSALAEKYGIPLFTIRDFCTYRSRNKA